MILRKPDRTPVELLEFSNHVYNELTQETLTLTLCSSVAREYDFTPCNSLEITVNSFLRTKISENNLFIKLFSKRKTTSLKNMKTFFKRKLIKRVRHFHCRAQIKQ